MLQPPGRVIMTAVSAFPCQPLHAQIAHSCQRPSSGASLGLHHCPLRVLRQGPITARAKFTLLIAGVKALSHWFPVTDERQQPRSGFSPWPPRLCLPVPEMKLFGLFLAQPHLSLGPLPLPFDVAFLPLKHFRK